MATVSGGQGQSGLLAGGASSFGQFRLTTFVDSTPKRSPANATPPGSRMMSTDEVADRNSITGNDGLGQSSSPALASSSRLSQASANVPSVSPGISTRPTASLVSAADSAPSAHNGFGIIDLASPAGAEGAGGKLGPHRDGRVRNPVPSKLKGKTDDKNGNFAVMHMDMSGSGGSDRVPRGEAAQRTSESTAQAARSAQRDGYKPLKRIRLETPLNTPPTQQNEEAQPAPVAPISIPVVQQDVLHRTRPLTSDETKYEQARLLTLLRSINPLTVVDQICKALAFFGGIPGAPPPQDGIFPESAESNGNGPLFIGWLSEIFPDLERKAWRTDVPFHDFPQASIKATTPLPVQAPTQSTAQTVAQPSTQTSIPTSGGQEVSHLKRPRGRPKGSKASKVRKDKGIKKGPKFARKEDIRGPPGSGLSQLQPISDRLSDINDDDDEWIDVVGPEPQLDKSSHPNELDFDSSEILSINPSVSQQSISATSDTGKRRPGRPRGSRNKPKEGETAALQTPQSALTLVNNHSTIPPESSPIPSNQPKRQLGRPSGSQSIPIGTDGTSHDNFGASLNLADQSMHNHSFNQDPEVQPSNISPITMNGAHNMPVDNGAKKVPKRLKKDHEKAMPQLVGLNAEEQAVLEAFRNARAAQSGTHSSGEKRKRPRGQGGVPQTQESPSISGGVVPHSNEAPVLAEHPTSIFPVEKPQTNSPVPTPNKRQRKNRPSEGSISRANHPQDKNTPEIANTALSRGIMSNNSAFSTTSVTPDATLAAPRAPAQGLEAHYEHFAHLQQRQEQQQPLRRDQTSITRSSPNQGSPFYQQSTGPVAQTYTRQFQGPQSYQQNPQNDTFRVINNQQQTTSFSPRQQTSQFTAFPDSSYIDLPALESVANGTAHVGAFGQGVSRAATQGSYGAGAGLDTGYDGSLSDNDLRERLLRGIGRR